MHAALPPAPTCRVAVLAQQPATRAPRINPLNTHAMPTRGKSDLIVPPRKKLNLFATVPAISPLPKSFRSSLKDSHWHVIMREEFDALLRNNTWSLVPRLPNANVVSGKWIFRHKLRLDGSLARYKARWVVYGFSQKPGIDFDETFSPWSSRQLFVLFFLWLPLSHGLYLMLKTLFSMAIFKKPFTVSNHPVSLTLLIRILFVV